MNSFVLGKRRYFQSGYYHKQVDGSKIITNISHLTTTLIDDELINNSASNIAKYHLRSFLYIEIVQKINT
jgi:hypothetical protein